MSIGVWSIFLCRMNSTASKLVHGSTREGARRHRQRRRWIAFPRTFAAWCRSRITAFVGPVSGMPPSAFQWKNASPTAQAAGLRIYEAHVGMATEEEQVGTFAEFTRDVLPRIAELGYNAIQLMAIMEHPYYGSFGYHVSNFLRRQLALRHAGGTEGADRHRPRPGHARAAWTSCTATAVKNTSTKG